MDKARNTVDFLLCAHRDSVAARHYFEKAIDRNGEPETITVDKSGANLAALQAINAERQTPIKIRQVKYLHNIVAQDHRAIKRINRSMMGFKDFRCACCIILSGVEMMHMIRKGQMQDAGIQRTAVEKFYSLGDVILFSGDVSSPDHIKTCSAGHPYRDTTRSATILVRLVMASVNAELSADCIAK